MSKIIGLEILALISLSVGAATLPNDRYTTGVLCSERDADFDDYDYDEEIPRCERNVGVVEKEKIAAQYGDIPKGEWHNYEFDHFIPLCAGGSNHIGNLWPQPHGEALDKDKLENQICIKMRAGTLTQAKAVKMVHDWFLKAKSLQAAKVQLQKP
jgi:hypothetical protein